MNYYQSSPASSLDIYELMCLINVNILSRTMVQVLLSEKQGDGIRMVDSPEAKQTLWMKCFICSFHGCSWARGPATLKRQQTPWSPSCRWLGPSSLETQSKLGSRRQGRLWRWNLSLTEMDRFQAWLFQSHLQCLFWDFSWQLFQERRGQGPLLQDALLISSSVLCEGKSAIQTSALKRGRGKKVPGRC